MSLHVESADLLQGAPNAWAEIEERVYLFVKLAAMDETAANLVLKEVYLSAISDPTALEEGATEEGMFRLAVSFLQEKSVRWSGRGLIAKRSFGLQKCVERSLVESLRALPLQYRLVFILHDMLSVPRSSLKTIFNLPEPSINRMVAQSRSMLLRFTKLAGGC